MAFVGSANNIITTTDTVAPTFTAIKTALLAAGWVIQGSSNGTSTFSNASSVDNTANFASNGSWLRIREPSGVGGREYVFYRGTATTALVKYSRSVGFGTGGALTTAPTTGASGDGVVWYGTTVGFSATGTGTNTYDVGSTGAAQCTTLTVSSNGYVSCVASDTTTNGVYGWWLTAYAQGSGTNQFVMYTDAVASVSAPATDYDPSYRQLGTGTNWWQADVTALNRCHCWQAYPLVWSSPTTAVYRVDVPGFSAFFSSAAGGGLLGAVWPPSSTATGLSIYNDRSQVTPYLIGASNVVGAPPKGLTSNVMTATGPFNPTDTLDLTTTTARIVVVQAMPGYPGILPQWLTFPWLQNVLPLV